MSASPISISSAVSQIKLEEYRRQDFWAAIIFYVNFGITLFLGFASLIAGLWSLETAANDLIRMLIQITAINTLITVVVAITLSIGALIMFRSHPMSMVHVSSLSTVVLMLIAAILVAHYGDSIIALLIGIVAAVCLTTYYRSRSYFNMSTALMSLISAAEDSNPSLYSVLIASLLVGYYYGLFALSSGIAMVSVMRNNYFSLWLTVPLATYIFLSYFWTVHVFLLINRTVVATVFEQYFQADPEKKKFTIMQILHLSFTRFIGSICFGSFLVFPVTNGRWYAQILLGLSYDTPFLSPTARSYNYYAFNNLIIKREAYREAAHQTWDDIIRSGVSQIVQGSCVGQMLTMCSFSIALITGFIAAAIFKLFQPNLSILVALIRGMASAFIISYGIAVFIFKILDAGTTAIFVILAQNPEGVRRKHPRLFEAIASYYHISA